MEISVLETGDACCVRVEPDLSNWVNVSTRDTMVVPCANHALQHVVQHVARGTRQRAPRGSATEQATMRADDGIRICQTMQLDSHFCIFSTHRVPTVHI
jgi:hypothetical protein